MADRKDKKRADGKRVALGQEHERRYLIEQVEQALSNATHARIEAVNAARNAEHTMNVLYSLVERLRAGFPAASKASKRRGK